MISYKSKNHDQQFMVELYTLLISILLQHTIVAGATHHLFYRLHMYPCSTLVNSTFTLKGVNSPYKMYECIQDEKIIISTISKKKPPHLLVLHVDQEVLDYPGFLDHPEVQKLFFSCYSLNQYIIFFFFSHTLYFISYTSLCHLRPQMAKARQGGRRGKVTAVITDNIVK